MKKLLSLALAALLLLSLAVSASAKTLFNDTMYVYTENGKSLNVRSTPEKGDNIIGSLKYGAKVKVTEFQGDWACIQYTPDLIAYVQSRYLQWYKPDPKPAPRPTEKPEPDDEEKKKEAELRSETEIEPVTLQAKATRASGWVNMRLEPSKATRRIEACADGIELIADAETTNWYHVTDPATGNSGYVHKNYVKAVPVQKPEIDEATQIGKLNVNGEFMLQGKIPEGYTLQVISSGSSRLIATLVAKDAQKPQMMLTVVFNEMFADKERMNDLSDEEIETLKASFTDMNEVEFSESETAAGTKLLIARETGDDEDFVSIFSLYKGYSVEFVLSPNPAAADHALTEEQIRTAVDFLSNLDFIPAN